MSEFDKMWEEAEDTGKTKVATIPRHEDTPEYLLKDGSAKINILVNILGTYFFAKHGEPMTDIFKPDTDNVKFILK